MSIERWRERVNQELAGASFDALVTKTNGLQVQPLYTRAPANPLAAHVGAVELGICLGTKAEHAEGAVWRVGGGEGRVLETKSSLTERGVSVVNALFEAEQGATAVVELALVIARMLDAQRAGSFSGVLALTASEEFYVSVAKVRALRVLARRTLAGWRDGDVRILARTSLLSFSRIDPETNAIRATIGSCAAIVGGADFVATAPFDVLTGAHDTGARLAFTTGLVATMESYLAASDDASRGSYAIETLTDELARAAWTHVRALEASGGIGAAQATAEALWRTDAERYTKAVATQRIARVGATKLALVDANVEGVLQPEFAHIARDTAAMEAWREHAPKTPVLALILGDARKLSARADYVAELFTTLGSPVERAYMPSAELKHAIIVVVAEDASFATLAQLIATLPKTATIVVAGKPGAHEAALREAGVKSFVFVGMNVLTTARDIFQVKS